MRKTFVVAAGCLVVVTLASCGPTYPKERFSESIVRICQKEYKLDVKVETVGKTVAIYLPLSDLIDFTFAISKTASDKINDVILSVSRVSLSTNAQYDFYCVIAHDTRIPEIQIVIIKSVDDVKRFLLNDISRSEYSKRMLIDIRMSPQAQKERAIKEIFEKMRLDRKWQDQVMNDFFRSEPTALGDIGYWGGRFYVKDISLGEFLSEQIASRVKIEFREKKDLTEAFTVKTSKGSYLGRAGNKYFKIETSVERRLAKGVGEEDRVRRIFETILTVAADVIHGYRFDDFEYLEAVDTGYGESVKVLRDDLEKYRKHKATLEEIIR